MKDVNQIKLSPDMCIENLIDEMEKTKVLGAGRLSKATRLISEIFGDKRYSVFLTLAGPLVPGGLRSLIRFLIAKGYIHGLISTGANITHDLIESIGIKHKVGDSRASDIILKRAKINRIYDIYIEQKAFAKLEKKVYQILEKIPEKIRTQIPSYELLWEIGKRINDRNSILTTAENMRVPIICPCLQDSILGLHLWTFSRLKPLSLNPFSDLTKLTNMLFDAKKVGAIILGGGVPKHHILIASTMRGGVDAAIQITLDRPEGGGLSGASLEEAISWRKIKSSNRIATVIGDVTMIFPIMVLSAIRKIDKC
jgi:deoxyhypusine synthase